MPISNQPNLAALQAAIVNSLSQAITDSQGAIVANTDSKTAAVAQVVIDETSAAETLLANEIAAKATDTQNAVAAKGVIKSIQRGTSTASTVTISAVNTAKAMVTISGNWANTFGGGGANSQSVSIKGRLSSSTQLVLVGNGSADWEVVEYE